MTPLTEAQRQWLAVLGINAAQDAAVLAPVAAQAEMGDEAPQAAPPATAAVAPTAAGAQGDEWSAPDPSGQAPAKAPYLDPSSPEMRNLIMRSVLEQEKKDKAAAEQHLAEIQKQLTQIRKYIADIPGSEMAKSSYGALVKDIRDRYPEVADLSQWVRQTSGKVPSLKGKLPSPKALMETVEAAVKLRAADIGWSVSTGRDLASVAGERLLAAYLSQLPSGVSIKIDGGVVKLSRDGAALKVNTPVGEVDAKAGKDGVAVSLKGEAASIEISNEDFKEFDPKLRGQWQLVSGETTLVMKLRADRDKAKLELDLKGKDGGKLAADLQADFDKKEAEFNLAWTQLQEKVTATAKASEQKLSASVAYLKKDKADKDAVKAGAEVEVDFKALQGKLKAYYASPTLEAVLEVAAAADKVSAKLEVKAVKTGTVVTAAFEKSLQETKAAVNVTLGKTTVGAELSQKLEGIAAKIKVVQETKDLKLAVELEKTLKDVRGKLELEIQKGRTTAKVGVEASSDGKVGGKAQIDIALKDGRSFTATGDKLSFAANVSSDGYKFEVTFSMGRPVETGSLQDLFSDADRQIKELYKLAADQDIRSLQDMEAVNRKMQAIMASVNESAKKAQTLKKKSEIAASFGFSIEGEWPTGGKASPPAAMFTAKIEF